MLRVNGYTEEETDKRRQRESGIYKPCPWWDKKKCRRKPELYTVNVNHSMYSKWPSQRKVMKAQVTGKSLSRAVMRVWHLSSKMSQKGSVGPLTQSCTPKNNTVMNMASRARWAWVQILALSLNFFRPQFPHLLQQLQEAHCRVKNRKQVSWAWGLFHHIISPFQRSGFPTS